jgi:muramoyltetrapeptide carboxypeptidase LdcA involved in peptidoglycan recycling
VLKPRRLSEGSVVAIVSPSWGGPHAYPRVYEKGLEVLREDLGLEVREMDYTRAPQTYLRKHQQMRAIDINNAFADREIDAILASVGGDDSVRTLPYLDMKVVMANPKVLMGFSDTTTLLSYLSLRGMVTYYGPSVMAGIAQMRNYPEQLKQLREMLFEPPERYTYRPAPAYNEGYPDWGDEENIGKVLRRKRSAGWKTLQGRGKVRGRLFGGCLEVLEMMKATRFWPPPDFWKGRVLFLETSEMLPSPDTVKFMLRNYGMIGAFDDISALLLGRPRGYSRVQKAKLEENLIGVIAEEFGRPDLPVIANLDFGHTDPQMVLPLGLEVEVDADVPSLTLLEPPVT